MAEKASPKTSGIKSRATVVNVGGTEETPSYPHV